MEERLRYCRIKVPTICSITETEKYDVMELKPSQSQKYVKKRNGFGVVKKIVNLKGVLYCLDEMYVNTVSRFFSNIRKVASQIIKRIFLAIL